MIVLFLVPHGAGEALVGASMVDGSENALIATCEVRAGRHQKSTCARRWQGTHRDRRSLLSRVAFPADARTCSPDHSPGNGVTTSTAVTSITAAASPTSTSSDRRNAGTPFVSCNRGPSRCQFSAPSAMITSSSPTFSST